MLGRELIAHIRETMLDDNKPPYLWEDAELLRCLSYAEDQACRRAHLIIDDTTANDYGTSGTAGTVGVNPLCRLTVVADQAAYTLSKKILQIKRCQLASMAYPLVGPLSYSEMDNLSPGWIGTAGVVGTAGSGGYPSVFLNEPGNTITLIKSPSVNDAAYLVVSRLPLAAITLNTSQEIDEKYCEGLMQGAASRALLKNDADAFNLEMAKMYEGLFTLQFGPPTDAYHDRMVKTLIQRQRMQPRVFGS